MSRFAQLAQQVNALPVIPQRRGLFGGLRNFAQQAQQPGGFVDRLGMFGAQMQDIGQLDGVNRAGRLSEMRAAPALAAAEAAMQQERLGFQRNADRRAEQEAGRMQYFNTRGGVVGVDRNGQSQMVYETPPDEMDTMGGIPTGMMRNPDGSLGWAPGYVEAQGEVGRVRRRVVVDNPLPTRARASGSGGRSPSPSGGGGASAPRIINPNAVRWD